MAVSKENLTEVVRDTEIILGGITANLNNGCSLSDLFDCIALVEDKMRYLRELTVKHSKELAKSYDMPGVRLDGKPDRRFKAAQRV